MVACVAFGVYGSRIEDAAAKVLDRSTATGTVPAKLPTPASGNAGDLQTVVQARAAGVQSCLPVIASASRLTTAGTYSALSTWNTRAPNERLYNAVSGQRTDNKESPRAVSVLVASPTRSQSCDATTVEVHPSTLACTDIEAALTRDGKPVRVDMTGIPLLQVDPTLRFILMSAPSGGCVVIGVRTLYAP